MTFKLPLLRALDLGELTVNVGVLGGDGTFEVLFSTCFLLLLTEVVDFCLPRGIFDLGLRRDTLDLLSEILDLDFLFTPDLDLLWETFDFDLRDVTFDLLTLPKETDCLTFPEEIVDLDLLLLSEDLTLMLDDDDLLPWEWADFGVTKEDDHLPLELTDFGLPCDTFDLPRLLLADLMAFPLDADLMIFPLLLIVDLAFSKFFFFFLDFVIFRLFSDRTSIASIKFFQS